MSIARVYSLKVSITSGARYQLAVAAVAVAVVVATEERWQRTTGMTENEIKEHMIHAHMDTRGGTGITVDQK